MNAIDDIKRRAGLPVEKEEVSETAIYSHNPENPEDPEVLVHGVGRYQLSQVKENIRRKLDDIVQLANSGKDDHYTWKQMAFMLNHAAMHEMVKTIVAAQDELEEMKDE